MRLLLALLVVGLSIACASAQRSSSDQASTGVAQEAPGEAVQKLRVLERGRRPAAELTPYLSHPDTGVRARAALALARVADPAGASALVKALGDKDPTVRSLAAFALGALDTELPLLADQLAAGHKGAESWVREAAQARADAERSLDARLHIDSNTRVRRAVYAALGRMVIGPGLHHIYAGLGESDEDAALAAIAYGVHAVRRGKTAHRSEELTQQLIGLGTSEDAEVRFGAVFALARHERSAAAELFADRLHQDSDVRVRTWAARGLGSCPGRADDLTRALDDVDWRVRAEILRALQRRDLKGDPFDKAAVRHAAESAIDTVGLEPGGDLSSVHVLAAALPLIADRAELSELRQRWDRRLVSVDVSRLQALGTVSCALAVAMAARTLDLAPLTSCAGVDAAPLERRRRELRALGWAVRSRPALIARLHPYLGDEEPRVRVLAAQALARADDAASRTLLRARLAQESDSATVEAIADVIAGWDADPSLVEELRAALARTDGSAEASVLSARASLARALVKHGSVAAAELLAELAASEQRLVRRAVRLAQGERPRFGGDPGFGPRPELEVSGLDARLRTVRGPIELTLLGDETPETVANFVKLARRGYFDGLTFHRVVPGFVVQGGDPRGDGYGGPGYIVPCEITPRPFRRGVVGMALAGKDTGGSQFFITQSHQPHLDGGYTAFAEVKEGWTALDSLLPGDRILGVDVFQRQAEVDSAE